MGSQAPGHSSFVVECSFLIAFAVLISTHWQCYILFLHDYHNKLEATPFASSIALPSNFFWITCCLSIVKMASFLGKFVDSLRMV